MEVLNLVIDVLGFTSLAVILTLFFVGFMNIIESGYWTIKQAVINFKNRKN